MTTVGQPKKPNGKWGKYRDELVQQVVASGRQNPSGWVRVNCPFCPSRGKSPDRKSSFAFNPRTNGFVCNRCKIKGRVGGAVSVGSLDRKLETNWRSAVEDFLPLWDPNVARSQSVAPALAYLKARGFETGDIINAGMHVAVTGQYAGRIILPHKAVDGSWWGFTARTWGSATPKVLYPIGMERSMLYNEQALLVETERPALIVEGVLDAVWYLPDVVACLGKPTEAHLLKFVAAKRPIVFCLDGDAWEEGVAWAKRCALRNKHNAMHIKFSPGEDPNSVDPDWLWQQVEGLEVQRALENLPRDFF